MSTLSVLLLDLARLHEDTAARLRLFVDEASRSRMDEASVDERVLTHARTIHASLGVRQEEALKLIAKNFPDGVGTGYLTKAMDYNQPNVYLTLAALEKQNLVRKDDAAKPHRYYLSDALVAVAKGDSR